jgi:hypothetical protein
MWPAQHADNFWVKLSTTDKGAAEDGAAAGVVVPLLQPTRARSTSITSTLS